MSKLVVTKYKDGLILKSKEGSDRASIYVTMSKLVNRNGSIWEQKRIAHLQLPKAVAESFNLQEGQDLNAKLEAAGLGKHTIVMQESTTPFYEGQEPKRRGEDGDIITDDAGNPIFQDYKCVPAEGAADALVARNTAEEAVEAAEEGDMA